MIPRSTARRLALYTLAALLLPACAEPSGVGKGTPAEQPAAEGSATPAQPPATEVLAAGDPAAEQPAATAEAEAPADPEPVAEADGAQTGEVADEAADDAAAVEPKRVLILGDSLAATGFGALLEDKLDAHPQVTCYRKGKSASGLARPDFFDWFDQGKRQVEFRKPDLVIVVMGGNDGQDLPPWRGAKRVRWGSEEWPEAYRARVDDFLTTVTEGVDAEPGAQVLWLGLPQMGLRSLERKLVTIRQLQSEAVAALGERGVYLETTPFLVDEAGALLRTAVVNGKTRELRADDAIHFTMAGSEYLADKVLPEVLELLELPPAEDG